jgi:Uma2 family endonuclease
LKATNKRITTDDSEPEPDVAVIRGTRRDYRDRHPSPADVGLITEVADATLQRDRTRKKRIYAHAGIPVYWIINLVDRQIEVYSNPQPTTTEPDYLHQQNYQAEDELLVVLDGVDIGRVLVRELLS